MIMSKEEKQQLRTLYKARREALPPAVRASRDTALCEALAATPSYRHASTVLAYAPIGAEIDLLPLLRASLADGKRVALPRSLAGGIMTFHYIESLEELVPGAYYGIPEPPTGSELFLPTPATLCLVPGIVFDRGGYRIGYGGGYYDRFLRDFDGAAIGVVYHDFILPALPRGRYDLAVSALATDRGILPVQQ